MKSKELRKTEALERQSEYNKLTVPQKVLKLDILLGGDNGAKKERAKLARKSVEQIIETAKAITASEKKGKPYQKPKRS